LRQLAIVVVMAGISMATGWWLFQGPGTRPISMTPVASPEVAESPPVRHEAPAVAVAITSPTTPAPSASANPAAPIGPPETPPPKPASPPATPAAAVTFQKDILPIFQAKCVTCHGANNKVKGGLDLRSVTALSKGGDSGSVVLRGDPDKSLLWETVSSDQMPPDKNKLSAAEKSKLRQWIVNGQ
jgi:mono/diheme cytochrome c family protein